MSVHEKIASQNEPFKVITKEDFLVWSREAQRDPECVQRQKETISQVLQPLEEVIRSQHTLIQQNASTLRAQGAAIEHNSRNLLQQQASIQSNYGAINLLTGKIEKLHMDVDKLEQRSKASNIIINGVVENAGENVCQVVKSVSKNILQIDIPDDQLVIAHRLPTNKEGIERPIIAVFNHKSASSRQAILSTQARKKATERQCDIEESKRVFFNQHLTKHRQTLDKQAKELRKQGLVKYNRNRNGDIAVVQHDGSVVKITKMEDFSQVSTHPARHSSHMAQIPTQQHVPRDHPQQVNRSTSQLANGNTGPPQQVVRRPSQPATSMNPTQGAKAAPWQFSSPAPPHAAMRYTLNNNQRMETPAANGTPWQFSTPAAPSAGAMQNMFKNRMASPSPIASNAAIDQGASFVRPRTEPFLPAYSTDNLSFTMTVGDE